MVKSNFWAPDPDGVDREMRATLKHEVASLCVSLDGPVGLEEISGFVMQVVKTHPKLAQWWAGLTLKDRYELRRYLRRQINPNTHADNIMQ